MSKLFGIPIGDLAAVLAVALLVVVGLVLALALRNRVFFRLGVRNVRRRRGRSVLIVVGLMLGTAIITAALTTGDTMSHTIRSAATTSLGKTDEVVAAKGVEASLVSGVDAAGVRYFPQEFLGEVAAAARGSGLVAAVAPAVVEPVAVQDVTSRQNEPRVTLFASDPKQWRRFGSIHDGSTELSLGDLRPGQVFLNAKAAEKLGARAGDVVTLYSGARTVTARVRAIVRYDGAATSDEGLLMR